MSADAIVIGGGFAGLSAATAMAERGRRVLLLEARATLGGRASTFTDPATGERVDNGQHALFGCYHETFRFLRRIGSDDAVRVQPTLALDIVDASGRCSRLSCPPLPAPLHLLAGVVTWRAIGWGDRVAMARIGSVLLRADRTSPDETVREWLARHGQTPRLIDLFWGPLAVAALNQPIDVAAAAPFATVLRRMFTFNRRDASVALPRTPLEELYARPAADFLERRGSVVRVGSPARIERVAASDPIPLRVRVRDEEFAAPIVVCAVPWYALAHVFADPSSYPELRDVFDAARCTAASSIVTVNLWFDRAVTDVMFVGLPGRTMQWVFDKRLLVGEQTSHLSLVSSGAEAIVERTNRELIDLALSDIAALPAARAAVLRRAVVVREKRATFSVAPGQPARPPTRTAVPGLLLAGDWIDTGLPATIESAVLSGHRAANFVMGSGVI